MNLFLFFTALKPKLACVAMNFGALAQQPNNCLTAFPATVASAIRNSTHMLSDVDQMATLMCRFVLLRFNIEPSHVKTNTLCFRPGPTKTGLCSHRSRPDSCNFGFRKREKYTKLLHS